MYFSIHLPIVALVLLASALLLAIIVCLLYCRPLYLVRRRNRLCNKMAVDGDKPLPTASVVVYARCEPEGLGRLLPRLLQQDYPQDFDIVVVNEGVSPETDVLIESLSATHPNLYLTFTPDGARNLSRKKLAITLGVKAAKGEAVVITEASAIIESNDWLRAMVSPMADEQVDVVLGYGLMQVPRKWIAGRLVRAFDMCADSVAWICAALRHHPYRGCGYNLAYRRRLFFENKGFSRSLNLRGGDDDIFVSEIAYRHNTFVQLSDASYVSEDVYRYKRATMEDRLSHAFTGRKLYKGTRRLSAACQWCMWIVLAAAVCGAWLGGVRNIAGWAAAVLIVVGMFVIVSISWRRTLRVLQYPPMCLTIPLIAMLRPLRNLRVSIKAGMGNRGHYTWQ